jgi:hypothetical protein
VDSERLFIYTAYYHKIYSEQRLEVSSYELDIWLI